MDRRIDVSTMLGSLDADPVGRVIRSIVVSSSDATQGEQIAEAIAMVRRRLKNVKEPLLTVEQADVFRRIAPPSFGVTKLERPMGYELFLVGVHARAKELLAEHGSADLLADLAGLSERVKERLSEIEKGSLGEFVVELAAGAARSPNIHRRLAASAEELHHVVVPGLNGLEKQAKALMRQKNGTDECECIVSGCNDYGDCQAFCIDSWWECFLILVGIILIIILTA